MLFSQKSDATDVLDVLRNLRYWSPEWARESVLRLVGQRRDLRAAASMVAYIDSAAFVDLHLQGAVAFTTPFKVLDYALAQACRSGFVAEFGVYRGRTIRRIARSRPLVHGFDSFAGLPESWVGPWTRGAFALRRPPVVSGVEMHVGWFEDTLPVFLNTCADTASFVHLDADLFTSTTTVLDCIVERLVPGTVILFDEYFNFPGWRGHEHRAWVEFLSRTSIQAEYLAYNPRGQQVAVRVIDA